MKFIKRNIDRIVLIFIILILLAFIVFYAFDTLKRKKEVPEAKKVDEITDYKYYLQEDDSDLYGKIFEKMKEVLIKEEIDYDEYAKNLALLFAIDFYNLDNKVTNMDIGGIQYIYSNIKDNFILKASDTIYKNVKSNIYGDRKQELPKVNNVEIKDIKNISFKYDKINDTKAYEISVYVFYEKDLGYPNEVTLTIVHDGKKLVIVEVN